MTLSDSDNDVGLGGNEVGGGGMEFLDDYGGDVEQNSSPPGIESRREGSTMPVGRHCSEEENQVKRFARDVGRLEKFGSQVKTMTVAWAAFVLLGAFSNSLSIRDFWFSTIVLLENKIGFFNRKFEVEKWHCQMISNEDAKIWKTPRLFGRKRYTIMFFYLMKLVAAFYFVCKTISVPSSHLVGAEVSENDIENDIGIARNKKYSLVLFYLLTVLEVLLLLSAELYYLYSIFPRHFFDHISRDLGFEEDDLVPIQSFFIDCYYSSEGEERDMVTFGVELLSSDLRSQQLVGVRIVKTFMNEKPGEFSQTVLTNIGANTTAIETLVAMLDWEDRDMFGKKLYEDNYETCYSASSVLLRLTENDDENALRVGSLPGSMKTIGCLLETNRGGFGEERGSEMLASLAKEEESKERIGRNGKLVKRLFKIFFNLGKKNGNASGKAIQMLTLEGESNCIRILKLNVLKRLIRTALRDPNVGRRLEAAKICRNLCTYSGESANQLLKGVTAAALQVFQMIVSEDKTQGKEIMVGIAAFICKSDSLPNNNSSMVLKEFRVSEDQLAAELVSMLINYSKDSIITRSVIEIVNWMISGSPKMVEIFMEKGLEKILTEILEQTDLDEKENEDFEIHMLIETTVEMLPQQTTQTNDE